MNQECESNIYGTSIRDGDGLTCTTTCKPGYTGNKCENCEFMFYASNGTSGSIDLSSQEGPICKGRS